MFQIKTFQFNPIQENTYLLYNETKECIIIDPGCYFEEEQIAISKFIDSNHLIPKLLVNTHCHLDHVFGNKYIAELYNLELNIHAEEEKVLLHAPTSGLIYNMPFDNYKGSLKFIVEGQKLKLGEDELSILFTPGHSPGSVSFYCKKQSFVISGDVLFQRSIGRTDLPGGDLDTLLRSIKTQLLVLPDETVVYSGHGAPTTIGAERLGNDWLRGN
jgi:glyoxylase-like metal-dependent hydrolase (beta-lactamase superfamily II)